MNQGGTERHTDDAAATRVVDAQRQAGGTLKVSVGFLVASAVATVMPHETGAWLPLHLFLVGSVPTAIAAATQLLAVTWSAAPAPPAAMVTTQRWCLGAGAAAVALGRELDCPAVAAVGGVAVLAGFGAVTISLVAIRSGGRTDRFRPAIDAYLVALAFAFAGVALGVAMVLTDPSMWWVRVRAAHTTANVYGFVGFVIAGTLPYFVATQARMRMSRAATRSRIRAVVMALLAAVSLTIVGQLSGNRGATSAGYLLYATGLLALFSLLPHIHARQLRWAGPRLVQLATGFTWWVVATVLLALRPHGWTMGEQPLRVLAIGGIAQILVASLAYFGPVLRGGGHVRLAAGFLITRSWPSVLLGNTAAVSILIGAEGVTAAASLIWVADVLHRGLRLAVAPTVSALKPDRGDET